MDFVDKFSQITPIYIDEDVQAPTSRNVDAGTYDNQPEYIEFINIKGQEYALLDPGSNLDYNKFRHKVFTPTRIVVPRAFQMVKIDALLEEIDNSDEGFSLEMDKYGLLYDGKLNENVMLTTLSNLQSLPEAFSGNPQRFRCSAHPCSGFRARGRGTGGGICVFALPSIREFEDLRRRRRGDEESETPPVNHPRWNLMLFYVSRQDIIAYDIRD